MQKLKAIRRLMRVRQYYKNVIMFVGVFFGGKLFNFEYYPHLFLGFILLCMMSSINYIINDIMDIEKDKVHPEKSKKRPLASGTLSKNTALGILVLFLVIEILGILYFWNLFSVILLAVFLNGQLYNLFLKKKAFADVLALSMIYVWRVIGGCVIINLIISPWLFLTVYLTALLLSLCKRRADLELIKDKDQAINHKNIYEKYNVANLDQYITMVATSLLITYILYCIIGPTEEGSIISPENSSLLVYSIPFALYLIMRFVYLTSAQPEVARNAEKMLKDRGMLVGGILFALMIFIILYVQIGSLAFFIIEQ